MWNPKGKKALGENISQLPPKRKKNKYKKAEPTFLLKLVEAHGNAKEICDMLGKSSNLYYTARSSGKVDVAVEKLAEYLYKDMYEKKPSAVGKSVVTLVFDASKMDEVNEFVMAHADIEATLLVEG